MIDVTNPASPQLLGNYGTPGYASGVAISGSIAYVADSNSGLQIIDTSILQNTFATEMAATDDYLYLGDTGKTLYTLDISDISNMRELNNYPLTYHA